VANATAGRCDDGSRRGVADLPDGDENSFDRPSKATLSPAMKPKQQRILSNHNRCWIWGRNVVLETVRAAYWPVIELLYTGRCDEKTRTEVLELTRRSSVQSTFVSDDELKKHCRTDEHQGLAARMQPYPYRNIDALLRELPPNPVLVMLDRIHDSYNFGAIVRSVDVLGIHGVIVGRREQSTVNSLVARSSAGAVNYVPICQVEDLCEIARQFRADGFQIVGTSDHADHSIFQTDLCRATILLIGNEGRGIHPDLEAVCTHFVQIPVLGKVNSLNAAVSAGIFFYEAQRQRSNLRS
jgi:23S rRNA (guanosine2251-2'-O)-methyltransferase